MRIAYAAWTRRLTVITALVLGIAAASVVDANARRDDRRDRREDRRELRQERRQDRRQLRREDRQERRREYRQEYRQDRRRHRIHRVVVTPGVVPHCAVVPGFTGYPMISLGADRFHWSASLGLYVPNLRIEAQYGECPPRGSVYYDPYCGVPFANLSSYRVHMHDCGHPAALVLSVGSPPAPRSVIGSARCGG